MASFLRQGGKGTHGSMPWEEKVGKGREMHLDKENSCKELKKNKT